jgi:hypothetical protein
MKPIYMLHKLPEGFVVTSDEIPHKGDIVINNLDNLIGKSTRELNQGEIKDKEYSKVIAQQDQIIFNLSEEEQKKIGWFDVEKLAHNNAVELWMPEDHNYYVGHVLGYKQGFQKAQELLSDKVFTLNEVKGLLFQVGNAMRYKGVNYASYYNYKNVKEEVDKVLQSLPQKSWQVELEMEWVIEGDEEHDEGGTLPGIIESYQQPKLTNGKVTITKIL